jgi:hypothetical protein
MVDEILEEGRREVQALAAKKMEVVRKLIGVR